MIRKTIDFDWAMAGVVLIAGALMMFMIIMMGVAYQSEREVRNEWLSWCVNQGGSVVPYSVLENPYRWRQNGDYCLKDGEVIGTVYK